MLYVQINDRNCFCEPSTGGQTLVTDVTHDILPLKKLHKIGNESSILKIQTVLDSLHCHPKHEIRIDYIFQRCFFITGMFCFKVHSGHAKIGKFDIINSHCKKFRCDIKIIIVSQSSKTIVSNTCLFLSNSKMFQLSLFC